jgi:hypothetical protein
MVLSYSLTENLLTAAPNDFSAQPQNVRSCSQEDIVNRMAGRNTGLSISQINAVLDDYIREVCLIIAEGGGINTPLVNIFPSIAGVFHGAADTFDARRHRIKSNLTPGVQLRRATAGVKTQKVQTADPIPFIVEVHDVTSNTTGELLTPGGVVQIRGGRLKLATANPENGIFLTGEQGQSVKLGTVIENRPARLIAALPADLPAGAYTLEVRTTLSASSNKESKAMKKGRFLRELTAVSD